MTGSYVFYLLGGDAFRFATGSGETTPIGSGGESTVVNVSDDGSHVFFVSEQQLDGGEGQAGAENLYVWDGASVSFVVVLASEDMVSRESSLVNW